MLPPLVCAASADLITPVGMGKQHLKARYITMELATSRVKPPYDIYNPYFNHLLPNPSRDMGAWIDQTAELTQSLFYQQHKADNLDPATGRTGTAPTKLQCSGMIAINPGNCESSAIANLAGMPLETAKNMPPDYRLTPVILGMHAMKRQTGYDLNYQSQQIGAKLCIAVIGAVKEADTDIVGRAVR